MNRVANEKKLWIMNKELDKLNRLLEKDPVNTDLLMQRGKIYLALNERGQALNDFNEVLEITRGKNKEAQEYVDMINRIFDFVYLDNYNP